MSTEPIYKDEEPFMNFNKFLYDFDFLFINCGSKNNNNYVDKPERIKMLCDKLWENKISVIAERAKHEIQKQIFTSNPNADKLIRWVENECEKLNAKAKHLTATYSNVNVHLKFIKFYNTVQVMWNFYDWFNEMKLLFNKEYDNSEYHWINEAKAKGINIRSAQFHNFINIKKAEKQEKEAEEQRIRDYDSLIGAEILYPTFEKFKKQINIHKLNPDKFKYGVWLLDENIKYTNARHYYTVWGARGTGIDRGDLYDKILVLIQEEIELCNSNPVNKPEENLQKVILTENLNKEKAPAPVSERKKYSTLDYALFHYYKQVGKHEPEFVKDTTTTIREAMKKKGREEYKVGADSFANSFYSICKKERRISKANIPHIIKAIEILSDCPAGKKIAEKELKEAELLP